MDVCYLEGVEILFNSKLAEHLKFSCMLSEPWQILWMFFI